MRTRNWPDDDREGRVEKPSPDPDAVPLEVLHRMTCEQRLELALEMSDRAHELAAARLRKEHPDWTEEEVRLEQLREAFGSEPLPPPLRRKAPGSGC